MTLSPWRTGAVLGLVVGLWHLAWSVLVATGWAQWAIDFVLWLHFIEVPVSIAPFDPARAGALVAVTFILGFVGGLVFTLLWNGLHRPRR